MLLHSGASTTAATAAAEVAKAPLSKPHIFLVLAYEHLEIHDIGGLPALSSAGVSADLQDRWPSFCSFVVCCVLLPPS
jgi:hypothetical protein